MYPPPLHEIAKALVADGLTQQECAAALGVSQRSVSRWVRNAHRRTVRVPSGCPRGPAGRNPAYPLLLGFYLGDGHISRHPRRQGSWCFAITQDARYPDSVAEICEATESVFGTRPYARQVPGAVEVRLWTRHAVCVFPQHGPGRKHLRPIVLEPWQQEIVDEHPQQFLRGLFHSDGCRSLNTVRRPCLDGIRVYRYPRYLLSNESDDILCLAERSLDRIGVPHRRSRPNCLSVARREGVIALDAFIGPKH